MKKNRRILLAALVVILCSLLLTPAMAGTSNEGGRAGGSGSLSSQLNSLPPFKFEKHKYGIGYGLCPVYTAPSESAYRCNNGRAECQTNAAMDDAGFVSGWLLVRYETSKGNYRVGYIPPKYVRNYTSKMAPHFGFVQVTADETIYVSDNPMSHSDSFATLSSGETFYILSRYNYYAKNGFDWWYIQCDVDGQVACGFIEYNSAFH